MNSRGDSVLWSTDAPIIAVRVSRTGVSVLSGTGASWSAAAPAAQRGRLPAYAHIPSPAPADAHHPPRVAKKARGTTQVPRASQRADNEQIKRVRRRSTARTRAASGAAAP